MKKVVTKTKVHDAVLMDVADVELRMLAFMCGGLPLSIDGFKNIYGKADMYKLCYGANVLQQKIDEEGCGAVMGALRVL